MYKNLRVNSKSPRWLQRWVGVDNTLCSILIPPHTGGWSSSSIHIWSTSSITLAGWLDPYQSINDTAVRDSCWNITETSLNVAPVTPLSTLVLETGATLVDDEVCWKRLIFQERSEGLGVVLFIVRWTPFSVVGTWIGDVWVEVGDVGRETTDLGGLLDLLCAVDNFRKYVGSYEYVSVTLSRLHHRTYRVGDCRPIRAIHREQHQCTRLHSAPGAKQ